MATNDLIIGAVVLYLIWKNTPRGPVQAASSTSASVTPSTTASSSTTTSTPFTLHSVLAGIQVVGGTTKFNPVVPTDYTGSGEQEYNVDN